MSVSKPVRVFAHQLAISRDKMSKYELMAIVEDDGWTWQQWLPPSQRTTRMAALSFEPYVRDGPKVWYSGKVPSKVYLRCLLTAPDLFDLGLEMIPHGCDDKTYKTFLLGDVKLPQAFFLFCF